jgi:D-aspartate ligase
MAQMRKGNTIIDPAETREPATLTQRREPIGVVIIGGHFQGLGLLRSLAKQNVPTYLLDQGMCIAKFSRYAKRFSKCPDVKQEALFLEFLMDLARRENLEGWLIYPNDDETVYLLARYKKQLEEYYRVVTPSWDIVKFAYDKALTYQLAEQCHIAIPKTFYPRNVAELEQLDIEFPVVIKPSIKEPFFSRTKKKAIRVDSRAELRDTFTKAATAIDTSQILMVQELIPGSTQNLFSVGSIFRDGEILARVVARRPRQHPMDFGHATTFAQTIDMPELEDIARQILGAMGYCGLSEVEFMLDPRDGRYKLLEINARPWGWHSIGSGAGVDLPYLLYRDTLGEKIEKNGFTKGVKWIRLTTDIPTVAIELLGGRMKFSEYLDSLKGKKQFAVMSLKDPMPFIMELAMSLYLWRKRGFW